MSLSAPLQFRRWRGVTLVELMVTIAVMVLLGLMAVPYTLRWVYGAQVAESLGLAMQGYGHAKSLALRNPGQAADDGAVVAAGMKLVDGHVLLVCVGDPEQPACVPGGAAVQWQTDLGRGVGVTATFVDDAENVAALPLGSTAQVLAAQPPAQIVVRKGEESEARALH